MILKFINWWKRRMAEEKAAWDEKRFEKGFEIAATMLVKGHSPNRVRDWVVDDVMKRFPKHAEGALDAVNKYEAAMREKGTNQ